MVKALPIFSACVGKIFVKETKSLEPLASALGFITGEGQYIKLGCEVEGIRKDLVEKYANAQGAVCIDCMMMASSDNPYQNLENVFRLVKIPVIIVKNNNDIVVENRAIDLYKQVNTSSTELVSVSSKESHGSSQVTGHSLEFIEGYLKKNFNLDRAFSRDESESPTRKTKSSKSD